MSALRRAGVWLGLVEEEDERFDLDDEFAEDEDFAPPARPRTLARSAERDIRSEQRDEYRRGRSGGGERSDDRRDSSARRLAEPRVTEPRAPESRFAAETRAAEARAAEVRAAEARAVEARAAELRAAEARAADRDTWSSERSEDSGRDRASVRQLSRSTPPPGSPVSYPTYDNLALAPQVQLRERAAVNEDNSRRYQITTLHPTTYSEARTIGEHFRDGYPVIMNLTEMDEPDAKRLVDFAAGLAFGTRGSMERVTNRVFLLSPPNIQVSAEDKAKIAENGFFDQG